MNNIVDDINSMSKDQTMAMMDAMQRWRPSCFNNTASAGFNMAVHQRWMQANWDDVDVSHFRIATIQMARFVNVDWDRWMAMKVAADVHAQYKRDMWDDHQKWMMAVSQSS